MKMATKMVLLSLFAVISVSFQETTTVTTLPLDGTDYYITTLFNTIYKTTERTPSRDTMPTPTSTRHPSITDTSTTSTTTSTTTTTTTRSNTIVCMNGGTYDGIKCICPEFFFGALCDFTAEEIPSDRCMEMIPEAFKEFYDSINTSEGHMCVSHCNPKSPKFMDCNGGVCGLQIRKGPTCFCPKADVFMYTQPQCTGRISKIGLFAGVGVTIGLMLILVVVLLILCLKTKHKVPKKQTDEDAYYSTIK
ncbi:uncharacterized protein LOC143774306 [Ranitomeya variabilis]|uniref:uncharacterized protein LOC143774306 n=1 Tax=Ranitomeya variabilis TaxID=490064 RepID=UPI0040573861